MRARHRRYIDLVNTHTEPWYRRDGKLFITTTDLLFRTTFGLYTIPAGTKTDLFSMVPDTGYIRFHKAALLHDTLRGDPSVSRRAADLNFFFEMTHAIQDIQLSYCSTDCDQRVVDKEIFRLCRLASMYMLGVSGLIGSAYIAADKVSFKWLTKWFKRD